MKNIVKTIVLILVLSSPIYAQEIESDRSSPSLPLISESEISANKNRLIPEIYSLLKAGDFKITTKSGLPYTFTSFMPFPTNDQISLDKLDLSALSLQTLPFNTKEHIDNLAINPQESATLGSKLLWNINANLWSKKIISLDFNIEKLAMAAAPSEVFKGSLDRVYLSAIDDSNKTTQLFREIVRITYPEIINAYALLTFRFIGEDADLLWINSPANNETRQLTGSNRSDDILRTAVSLDDFFVWSGDPQMSNAAFTKTLTTQLVPFITSNKESLEKENVCTRIDSNLSSGMMNSILRSDVTISWFDSLTSFVARDLLLVEISQKDPFSMYGRQKLYIDAESNLPIYKIVYDKYGNPLKTVIGVWALAKPGANKRSEPYLPLVFIKEHKNNNWYLINTTATKYCTSYTNEIALSKFSPNNIKKGVEKIATTPTPVPTVTNTIIESTPTAIATETVIAEDRLELENSPTAGEDLLDLEY